MKVILRIAKSELKYLFYSPIAWGVFLLVYLLVCKDYLASVNGLTKLFQALKAIDHPTHKILHNTSMHYPTGFVPGLLHILYMIVPMLTMGTISREYAGGTINLVHSSSIRAWEFVLGKYLGLLALMAFLLVSVLLVYLGILWNVAHADTGLMAGTFFGIFLVFAAYAAIGLFLSSLTAHPLVAGLGTMAVIFAMNGLSRIQWDQEWFLDLAWELNLGLRASRLTCGLLNTGDASFLLLIVTVALASALIRIRGAQLLQSPAKQATGYTAVALSALLIGWGVAGDRYNAYWDTSRDGLYSVTPETEELLSRFDKGQLKLNVYSNLLDRYNQNSLFEQNKLDKVTAWWPFTRYRPDVAIDYLYYVGYDPDTTNAYTQVLLRKHPGSTMEDIAFQVSQREKTRLGRFMQPGEILRHADVAAEDWRDYFELVYKGDTARMYMYGTPDPFPKEPQIAAALKVLLDGPTKVAFLTDGLAAHAYEPHGSERWYLGYFTVFKPVQEALINNGYRVDTLSAAASPDALTGYDIVCLIDARKPLGDSAASAIQRYVASGGSLLLAMNPDRFAVYRPLLEPLGIAPWDGVLLQDHAGQFSLDKVFAGQTAAAVGLSPHYARQAQIYGTVHGPAGTEVGFHSAGALVSAGSPGGFRVAPLFATDSATTWLRPVGQADSADYVSPFGAGDAYGRYAPGVQLTRNIEGREQRILVFADTDYMAKRKAGKGKSPETMNEDLRFHQFSYLGNNKYPAEGVRPPSKDNRMKHTLEGVAAQEKAMLYVLPGLLLLLGAAVVIKRKRR